MCSQPCRTYLVSIATDTCDTLDGKVEGLNREASLLNERHDEATQATIDVQADLVLVREFAECNDVVLAAIGEVDGGANEL